MRLQSKLAICVLLLAAALCGCGTLVYRPPADMLPQSSRHKGLLLFRLMTRYDENAKRVTKVTETGYVYGSKECQFSHIGDVEVRAAMDIFMVTDGAHSECTGFWFKRKRIAIDLAKALYLLKTIPHPDPGDPRSEAGRFAEVARKYREQTNKPALPEEGRRWRVLAESAVQKGYWVDAALLYECAVEIAPWWPEGHFNSAIILAELKLYEDAIAAMKRYLLLVPDAPDARQAQDRIYEWEPYAGRG